MDFFTVAFVIRVNPDDLRRAPCVLVEAANTRDAAAIALIRLSENGGFDPSTEQLLSMTITP